MIKADENIFLGYREKMKRIDRIFTIAFYVCAVPAFLSLLVCLVGIAAFIMTVGIANYGSSFLLFPVYAAMLYTFLYARTKEMKYIKLSIGIIIVQIIIKIIMYQFPLMGLIQLGAQILCLRQMPEIDKLSRIDGYPDFNGIFTHDQTDKSVLLERPAVSDRNVQCVRADMDEIEIGYLPEHEKSSHAEFMESIGIDDADDVL